MEKIFKGAKGIYEVKKFKNLKEIVQNSIVEYADRPAFKFKTDKPGVLRELPYKEYLTNVINLTDDSFTYNNRYYMLIKNIEKLDFYEF